VAPESQRGELAHGTSIEKNETPGDVVLAQQAAVDEFEQRARQVDRPRLVPAARPRRPRG
jgi:hypothetical protein